MPSRYIHHNKLSLPHFLRKSNTFCKKFQIPCHEARRVHTFLIMDAPLLSPSSINRQAQMSGELQEWSKVFGGEVAGLVKPGFSKVDPATTTGLAQSSFMASLEGDAKKIEKGKSSLAKMVATKNKKLEEFLARQRIAERIVKRYEEEENERQRQQWELLEEEEEEDSK
jgi:hypothetical protein